MLIVSANMVPKCNQDVASAAIKQFGIDANRVATACQVRANTVRGTHVGTGARWVPKLAPTSLALGAKSSPMLCQTVFGTNLAQRMVVPVKHSAC